MELKIIPVYENLWNYIGAIETGQLDYECLWDEYAIRPYWDQLACWAPGSLDYMKPRAIKDVRKLRQQLDLLMQLDLNVLKNEFLKTGQDLPKADDDPLSIAIYPLDDENKSVKERQNGVLGACVFGNILIQVNPLAEDFLTWIPYVFAHEYHHSVWGNYWYVLHGGLEGNFLEYMINEGQADAFARHQYPTLLPQWTNPFPAEEEKRLWEKFSPILSSSDSAIFGKYMFGDEAEQIPWCAGYSLGYQVIHRFLEKNPAIGFSELIKINAKEIFRLSGYPAEG